MREKLGSRIKSLVLLIMFGCLISGLTAADIMNQTWKSIHNGVWSTGLKGNIARMEDGVITVLPPGLEDTFDVASSEIILNQQEPESLAFSGWLRREPGGTAPKALIAYDLLLLFADGTHRWWVLDAVPPEKSGEWIHTAQVFKPEKPLRAIRVLCLNFNSDTFASFRDITLEPVRQEKASEMAEAGVLENAGVAYRFGQDGESFCLRSIFDKKAEAEFLNPAAVKNNIWRISLQDSRSEVPLVIDGGQFEITAGKGQLEAVWPAVALPDGGSLRVQATVELTENGAASWNIEARIQDSEHYTMLDVAYPVIGGLEVPGDPEKACLLFPQDIGRLIRNPARNFPGALNLRYGTNAMTMQFLAFYGEKSGLYISPKDGEGYLKEMRLAEQFGSQGCFSFELFNPAFRLEKAYALPFPVETRLFQGDWFDACMIYREWALQQKWTSCGPLASREDYPEPLRKIGLSLYGIRNLQYSQQQKETRKKLGTSGLSVIPDEELFETVGGTINAGDFAAYVRKMRDYYGFPLEIFNHPYLDYFGRACPRYMLLHGYDQAARLIREMGCYTVPWTTMLRMDVDIQRYKQDDASRFATVDESGKPVVLFADGCMKALMCPATEYWHDCIVETSERLLRSNLSGIYYDEMCSTGAQMCLSGEHGHTIGGGNYGLNGYREIMTALHGRLRREFPDYYSLAEQNGEYLIGVHDLNYMFLLFHADLVPAFQAVYHDYSLCNSRLSGKFQDFAEEYAYADHSGKTNLEELAVLGFRNFTYGIHPGVVRLDLLDYSPAGAAIARYLGQTWLDNQKYVMFGKMLRSPEILSGNGNITTGLPFRDSTKYDYPAVRTSAWQAMDNSLALVLTNAATTELAPEVSFEASQYISAPYVILRERDNGTVAFAGNSREIRFRKALAPRSIAVLEMIPQQEKPAGVTPVLPDFLVWANHNLLEIAAGNTGKLSITVENTTDSAAKGRISISVGEGWQVTPGLSMPVELATRETRTFSFDLVVPREAKGLQSFAYDVEMSGGENPFVLSQRIDIGVKQYVEQQAAGKKCFQVKYLAQIPEGRLPEDLPVLNELTAKMLPGEHTVSPVQARFAWNEEKLVMDFTVKDELHHSPAIGEMIWQGDCLQLGLGFPRIESDTAQYYNQYEIYLANLNGEGYVSCSEKAYDQYLTVRTERREGETWYRLDVPKKLLREMFKGKKFPFTFTVNEHDGKEFIGWQEWTPGICGGKNKGAWGELQLSE